MQESFIGKFAASLCWRLLSILRNKKRIVLTREEIRQVDLSFSQFGEDLVVLSYFQNDSSPEGHFYIDAGAFDPTQLSTTLLLHKSGWTGINIDLDAHKIAKFNHARPQDYSVVAALSDNHKTVRHITYGLGATNRIADLSESNLISLCDEQPQEINEIETVTLTEVLENSPFRDRRPSYLNVDCEGHDLEVLRGLDYERYAPRVISVEAHEQREKNQLIDFLGGKGYRLNDIVRITLIFVRDEVL